MACDRLQGQQRTWLHEDAGLGHSYCSTRTAFHWLHIRSHFDNKRASSLRGMPEAYVPLHAVIVLCQPALDGGDEST